MRVTSMGPVLAALAGLLLAAPAAAIEVCRPNALGQIACIGSPTRGLEPLAPFGSSKTGLSRVQSRPEPGEPGFVPAIRTNSFGDTLLSEGEAPRPRPRICRDDSFGNLRC